LRAIDYERTTTSINVVGFNESGRGLLAGQAPGASVQGVRDARHDPALVPALAALQDWMAASEPTSGKHVGLFATHGPLAD
jgi:hypothetical protein